MRTPASIAQLASWIERASGRPGTVPMALLEVLSAPGCRPRSFAELRAAAATSAVDTIAALLLLERLGYVESGIEDGVRYHALSPAGARLLGILAREAAA
jgi:hypothetical protein